MEIIEKDEIKNKSNTRKIRTDKFLKEDLERYYIDEKKSLAEISRIYECHVDTIKSRLKKYGISIRPYGAFLVDDNGKTLSSKCNRGELSEGEYRDIKAKNKGYENNNEYQNKLLKDRGYENAVDYRNEQVKKKGYIDWNEYNRKMRYERGRCLPTSENKDCSLYLGVYIAERILPLLFENVEKMPDGNPGFDFICGNGYKIDVKSACLSRDREWVFIINKNKIADYFFMVAFDDREKLGVIHIWLIKGDSVIEKTNTYQSEEFIFNEKYAVVISKGNRSLKRWKKHEKTDLLEKAQKICNEFKNDNKCKIESF